MLTRLVEAAPTDLLSGILAVLAAVDPPPDQAARIDVITAAEKLKGAATAVQVRATVAFASTQADRDRSRGVDPAATSRVVGAQVGLARRQSPTSGSRFVGAARAWATEMPQTMTALTAGATGERTATTMVAETAALSLADRQAVDAEIGPRLGEMSHRRVGDAARAVAARLDPDAVMRKIAMAEADRHVSVRAAPDAMVWLSALVPVAAGVAAFAALQRGWTKANRAGDSRGRGQYLADRLIELLTGRAAGSDVGVDIGLVMNETTLFGGDHTPARIEGYGPIPAELARRLAKGTSGQAAPGARERRRGRSWIRRFYTHPKSGALVGMDSKARCFTGALRDLVIIRDQRCRTPFCDAPIRHADHLVPARCDGVTAIGNGQGLCERCNYTKEHPDWHTTRAENPSTGHHSSRITTPTGHTYDSTAPPILGQGAERADPSRIKARTTPPRRDTTTSASPAA